MDQETIIYREIDTSPPKILGFEALAVVVLSTVAFHEYVYQHWLVSLFVGIAFAFVYFFALIRFPGVMTVVGVLFWAIVVNKILDGFGVDDVSIALITFVVCAARAFGGYMHKKKADLGLYRNPIFD